MNKWTQKYSALSIIGVAALLSVAAFFIPVASTDTLQLANHWRMALTTAMVTTIAGGAILFLLGMGVFKAELQQAYRWFAFGLLLFAIALVQYPVLVFIGMQESFWANSGITIIPFVFSTSLMYYGLKKFSQLLNVKSRLVSVLFSVKAVALITLLFGVGAAFYSSSLAGADGVNIETTVYISVVTWSTTFGVIAAILAYKVREVIGESYRRLMTSLIVAIGALSIGGAHEGLSTIFLPSNGWYEYTGVSVWPFITAGVLVIYAGYMFNKDRTESSTRSASRKVHESGDNDREYIDSITTVAQLASRPTDIDPILDGLRQVTSRMQPGTKLSDSDHETLLGVYRKLEAYLMTTDPLQTYSASQLRAMLAPGFREKL